MTLEDDTIDDKHRIQQLEQTIVELRRRIDAITFGPALEAFAAAMRAPLKPGRAGGIARARKAAQHHARWPDGRYMTLADWQEIEREVDLELYMRHAAGGLARARTARRLADGTFAR